MISLNAVSFTQELHSLAYMLTPSEMALYYPGRLNKSSGFESLQRSLQPCNKTSIFQTKYPKHHCQKRLDTNVGLARFPNPAQ